MSPLLKRSIASLQTRHKKNDTKEQRSKGAFERHQNHTNEETNQQTDKTNETSKSNETSAANTEMDTMGTNTQPTTTPVLPLTEYKQYRVTPKRLTVCPRPNAPPNAIPYTPENDTRKKKWQVLVRL